jgi:bisphosphoglycerate-dependent phosphoglycerate mutase
MLSPLESNVITFRAFIPYFNKKIIKLLKKGRTAEK